MTRLALGAVGAVLVVQRAIFAPRCRVWSMIISFVGASGLVAGCATEQIHTTNRPQPARTCVVLSVGGPAGVAHLGALDAIRAAGIPIQCVYGNSFGALAGALYASSAAISPRERYKELIDQYQGATADDKLRGVATGTLVGSLLGGPFGAILGALITANAAPDLDIERLRRVLDAYLNRIAIESLPIRFAASHAVVDRARGTIEYRQVETGNLAHAVTLSMRHPTLFRLPPQPVEQLDPGIDRAARVPIEDACKVYKPATLIVINVTGDDFPFSAYGCEVLKINVTTGEVSAQALRGTGQEFERVYRSAYEATSAALRARRFLR